MATAADLLVEQKLRINLMQLTTPPLPGSIGRPPLRALHTVLDAHDIQGAVLAKIPCNTPPNEVVRVLSQAVKEASDPLSEHVIHDLLLAVLKSYAQEILPDGINDVVHSLLNAGAEDVVELLTGAPGPLEALRDLIRISELASSLVPPEVASLSENEQIAFLEAQIEIMRRRMGELEEKLNGTGAGPWGIENSDQLGVEHYQAFMERRIREMPQTFELWPDGTDKAINALKEALHWNSVPYRSLTANLMNEVVKECQARRIPVVSRHGRSKGFGNLIEKMLERRKKIPNYCFGHVCDQRGERLIIENLAGLSEAHEVILKFFEGQVLEVENKFGTGAGKVYGAVHYTIQIGPHQTFELQLMTYPNFVRSALDHYAYKETIPLTPLQRLRLVHQSWASALQEVGVFNTQQAF